MTFETANIALLAITAIATMGRAIEAWVRFIKDVNYHKEWIHDSKQSSMEDS